MGNKNRGRPAKPKEERRHHYVGIRYDDELRKFLDNYRQGQEVPMSEAAVWRLAMNRFRQQVAGAKR